MNPEIEEKLIQLQRYQEKRMKPEINPEKEIRIVTNESPSPPPRRRATSSRHDDDDEWVDNSPRKRCRSQRAPSPPPLSVAVSAVPAVTSVTRAATRAITVTQPSVTPVVASHTVLHTVPATAAGTQNTTPPSPAPVVTALDERRRAASNHSRLQMMLFKHKEMLKKDIIKKRGLLEKELGVEIQVGTLFILI